MVSELISRIRDKFFVNTRNRKTQREHCTQPSTSSLQSATNIGHVLTDSKYFQLKNWSDLQRAQWINTHSGAYASYVLYTSSYPVKRKPFLITQLSHSFGVVATLLEMIPVVSVFFSYTNTGMNTSLIHFFFLLITDLSSRCCSLGC